MDRSSLQAERGDRWCNNKVLVFCETLLTQQEQQLHVLAVWDLYLMSSKTCWLTGSGQVRLQFLLLLWERHTESWRWGWKWCFLCINGLLSVLSSAPLFPPLANTVAFVVAEAVQLVQSHDRAVAAIQKQVQRPEAHNPQHRSLQQVTPWHPHTHTPPPVGLLNPAVTLRVQRRPSGSNFTCHIEVWINCRPC